MMMFTIIELSTADLSFLPAAFISDILLLFFPFYIIFTNSYTFGTMFTKNTPLRLSVMLSLLPPLYILLIIVYLHSVRILCSLFC